MAKLPDGYVFIMKPNRKSTSIDISEHELIMCRNCIEYQAWGDTMCCMRLGRYCENTMPTDYCSYAKKKGKNND